MDREARLERERERDGERRSEFLSIGEVAKLTGVPVKTIRFYAEIGLLPPAATAPSRYRLYSAAEVWRLELIRTLRQMDFSLPDIRRMLAGDVPVTAAIDLHLEALALQIGHLTRIRGLLEEAKARAGEADASLADLHAIGREQERGDDERRRFLAEAVRTLLVDAAAPEGWRERLVRQFTGALPAEPSAEQEAALAELRAMLDDPEMVAAAQESMTGFWRGVRAHPVDQAWWGVGMADVERQARVALERGATAESPEAQAAVEAWVTLLATVAGQQVTPAFLRELVERAPGWGTGRTQRLTDALLRLMPPETQRTLPEVQRLLLDGLRWRVARLEEK